MPLIRKLKKYAKSATKAAGKRYQVSYGRRGLRMSKHSVARIAKDVDMIKSRLNVEKKFKDGSLTTGTVGQVNLNTAGYFTSTLTPVISLGTSENERVGGSIKLTGLHLQLQFVGQAACLTKRKMKIMVISSTENSVTNAINDLFDVNPLTGNVDYFSNLNYSNQKRAHRIIATKYFTLGQVPTTPGSGDPIYFANGVKMVNLKMNEVTRFEGSATTPKDMNYYLVIFCDVGNSHPSSSSTNSGAMVVNNLSGVEVQEYFRWWYVDN